MKKNNKFKIFKLFTCPPHAMIRSGQKGGSMEQIESARQRYKKENILTVWLKVNRKTEPELAAQLEKQPNKNGYLKSLIQKDIEKNN